MSGHCFHGTEDFGCFLAYRSSQSHALVAKSRLARGNTGPDDTGLNGIRTAFPGDTPGHRRELARAFRGAHRETDEDSSGEMTGSSLP